MTRLLLYDHFITHTTSAVTTDSFKLLCSTQNTSQTIHKRS